MCTHKPWCKHLGLLVLRLILGAIFVYHGYGKLTNIEATAGFFSMLHIPMATVMAYVVGLVELVGGALLILGLFTCIASMLLMVVMLVALFTAHLGKPFSGPMGLEFPLAVLGGLAALAGTGGGKWVVWKKGCCTSACAGKDGATCACGGNGACQCGADKKTDASMDKPM